MARVCCLIFLLLLSCLLLAEAGKRDRGERVRIRKKPKGGQCERIKENLCIGSGLPYNRTRLPNVFGHNKQKLVGRALQEYRSVVESGCSPYIRAFLCASFLPECPRRKRQDPLQPCRSLCENARRDCEQTLNAHGLPWPDELGCDMLPESKPGDKREKCINFEPPKPDYCSLHKDVGPCRTYYPFWYFDSGAKACQPFTYGGCLGNQNRFSTKEECLRTCGNGVRETVIDDEDDMMTNDKPQLEATSRAPLATTLVSAATPPVIDRRPLDSMVAEGQGSTLRCHAEGAVEYTWSRVGGSMPEAKIASEMVVLDEAILVLHNLTTQDSGLYKCSAENDHGVTEATAKITVMAIPRIVHVSGNVTLSKGDPFELICKAAGTPQPRVTWERKDGKRVLMRRNGTIAVLAVESSSISDTGTYICRAANSLGSRTEAVSVRILVPVRLYLPPVKTTMSNIGETVTWSCAASGLPQPSIRWEKIGGDLPGDRISLDGMMETGVDGSSAVKSKLTLSDLQQNDTSQYRCISKSTLGNESSIFSLTVNVPPRWEEKPFGKTVNQGDEVSFVCKPRGTEPISIKWRVSKGNTDVETNRSLDLEDFPRYTVTEDKQTFSIANVQPEDEELTYHCDVSNEAGAITASAQLEVVELWQLPAISTPLPNMTAFVGEDVRMSCETSGDPEPQVTWFLEEIAIETLMDERFEVSENGNELLVKNVNLRDAGSYRCVAANVNGLKSAQGRLRVVEPNLKLTTGLSNSTVEDNQPLNLVCAASGDPTPEVTWFFNDKPINVTAQPSYVIDGGNLMVDAMTSRQEGKYGCLFSNDFYVVSSIAMVNITKKVMTTQAPAEPRVGFNITTSPNDVIVGPSSAPDTDGTACKPCQETQIVPSCSDGQKAEIKPRRYDITDAGLKGYFRGWVDVTGQGAANDYCRIVMTATRGLVDTTMQLACALAGTSGHSEYNYVSGETFTVGQMDTWYMKDEDGDGKDDYCRCVSDGGPDGQFVYCTKADIGGFHGAPGVGESQFSFKAPGDRRLLRKCRKRKVDPFFGVASLADN
ncbi:immunoglobulin superfamily member 10-like isoform X1 [Asterias amurensis]|uniref:immunoglobulin superfamily member 10-like isoform X1 n=1 Tax=Asterias amurensis TaxID=7602 RepID=UPI003AB584B1